MWGNKKINSEEFEIISKKITIINGAVESLQLLFEQLKTNQNSLRGLINRKMSGEKDEREEEAENEPKHIKTTYY